MKYLHLKQKLLKPILGILGIGILLAFQASNKQAYQLYTENGKKVTYQQLVKEASKADIVLFGEMHNNPICHWLELSLTKSLDQNLDSGQLVLGAEMFERDDQLKLREYQKGLISQSHFEREAKLWDNYATDYKPLVEYAKSNDIPFHATNIPRRYAGLVASKGPEALDTLNQAASRYFPPLPVNLNMELGIYQKLKDMKMPGHESGYMAEAQAIKDATMAHFILNHYRKGQTFLHFNGNYHSKNFEGICWYLKNARPKAELDILTIGSVEQETIEKLKQEHEGMAHYILCIPEDMTKTY